MTGSIVWGTLELVIWAIMSEIPPSLMPMSDGLNNTSGIWNLSEAKFTILLSGES